MELTGRRRLDDDHHFAPGDYGRLGGTWWVRPPVGPAGQIRPPFEVTEHEDGTITVRPSIHSVAADGSTVWHGFLTGGVWSDNRPEART